MADFGRFVVFKPVSDGFVYRAPNAWLFGNRDHYLVNEAQKSEILTIITSSSRSVLWLAGISWITMSLLLAAGSLLLAHISGFQFRGVSVVLPMIMIVVSAYAAMLISRRLLLFRLRPTLDTLTPSNERITNLEERQAIAMAATTAKLSPARRRVIRIASAVAVAGTLGSMISRTVDAYEVNHSMLLALYDANANILGLLNVAAIVALAFAFRYYGRDENRT